MTTTLWPQHTSSEYSKSLRGREDSFLQEQFFCRNDALSTFGSSDLRDLSDLSDQSRYFFLRVVGQRLQAITRE